MLYKISDWRASKRSWWPAIWALVSTWHPVTWPALLRSVHCSLWDFWCHSKEVITNASYSEKADVYSFGVVIWEVLTRQAPWQGMQPMQIAYGVVHQVLFPSSRHTCIDSSDNNGEHRTWGLPFHQAPRRPWLSWYSSMLPLVLFTFSSFTEWIDPFPVVGIKILISALRSRIYYSTSRPSLFSLFRTGRTEGRDGVWPLCLCALDSLGGSVFNEKSGVTLLNRTCFCKILSLESFSLFIIHLVLGHDQKYVTSPS